MNILKTIEEWFKGKSEDPEPLPKYNTGQHRYESQTAPVEVQAQVEPKGLNPIPVDVCGIIPTWKLPNKRQVIKQTSMYNGQPTTIMDGDYKIGRVTLWVTGIAAGQVASGVYIGHAQDLGTGVLTNSVQGAQLPIDKPVVIDGLTEKLSFVQSAASVSANGNLAVNFIAERWAD